MNILPENDRIYNAYKKKTGIWCGNGFKQPTKKGIGDLTIT